MKLIAVLTLLACCMMVAVQSKTIMQFSRALDTCDSTKDFRLTTTTTAKLIYAFNNDLPSGNTPSQHTSNNRGTKSINLFSVPFPAPEIDTLAINLLADNYAVPAVDTFYYCQGYKLPNDKKRHVIRFEPVIQAGNEKLVHHFILYQCTSLSDTDLTYRGTCIGNSVPTNIENCQERIIYGWAIGASNMNLPQEAGFAIGESDSTYVLLQIHYNNPQMLSTFKDSSGVRLLHTDNLRANDAGIFEIGYDVSDYMRIPAGQQSYSINTYCPSECVTSIPDAGINVFGSLLHAHTAGRGLVLQTAVNGVELPEIARNNNYDFNYQETLFYHPPIKVYRNQSMYLQCLYNTVDRTNITYGGLATTDEMCQAYLWYYPKINSLTQCQSADVGNQVYVRCLQKGSDYYLATKQNITTPLPVRNCTKVTGSQQVKTATTFDRSSYRYSTTLDTKGDYMLYWDYNLTQPGQEYLRIAVEVNSAGWVGLGFSPTGGMVGSDVYLGWVDANGVANFNDRYASANALPSVDESQDAFDITLIKSSGSSSAASPSRLSSANQFVFMLCAFMMFVLLML